MQTTAVAALLSLAAAGLAAPTASVREGVSALGLRADEISVPETSQGAGVTPEMLDLDEEVNDEDPLSGAAPAVGKRAFNGGWCGMHMKIVEGDYHQADVTVKDSVGNTLSSRHEQVAKGDILHFTFTEGLPDQDALEVQIGGIVDGLVRLIPSASSVPISPFSLFSPSPRIRPASSTRERTSSRAGPTPRTPTAVWARPTSPGFTSPATLPISIAVSPARLLAWEQYTVGSEGHRTVGSTK